MTERLRREAEGLDFSSLVVLLPAATYLVEAVGGAFQKPNRAPIVGPWWEQRSVAT